MKYGSLAVVPGSPAMYHREKKALVIADLHLGFESEAAREGVYLPRLQLRKALDLLDRLHSETEATLLVIDGDLKHTFEKLTMQEREEVSKFLAHAKDLFHDVLLVRGNHDNYITIITNRFDVEVVESLRLDSETLLVHGHRMYSEEEARGAKYVVIGHEHPAIKVSDELGSVAKYPCFLSMPLTDGRTLLVLPAAGYYQTGNPVTLDRSAYLSPIVRKIGIVEEAVPIIFEPGGSSMEFPPLGELSEIIGDMPRL